MSESRIDRPIFLIGSGRSGTTLTYFYLSIHPELCWFSNVSNRAPWLPCAPLANRIIDLPGIGDGIRRDIVNRTGGRLGLRPVEAEILYERAGFDCKRQMTEADYTPELSAGFRKMLDRHIYWTGKSRFVSKQTSNNQHARLLNKIFPDALFIHLIRDGRAVANSILTQGWMNSLDIWWLGDSAKNLVDNYSDPIELCALHWEHNVDELKDFGAGIGDRYIEIRYEEMIRDYASVLTRLFEFCGLRPVPEHLELLPEPRKDLDDKWKRELSPEQIEIIHATIGAKLESLGYSV